MEDELVQDLKQKMLDKVAGSDWIRTVELLCNTYIDNNGLKTISSEEIFDHVIQQALSTFPKDVRQQMETEVGKTMSQLLI